MDVSGFLSYNFDRKRTIEGYVSSVEYHHT